MQSDFTEAKVLGQLSNASNATLLIEQDGQNFIYKPKDGERELFDFPSGTLYRRERAAYLVSELLDWDLVPETLIGEGVFGVGSFQRWVESQPTLVDIFDQKQVPSSWLIVTSGIDQSGKEVVLAHANDERLQKIALFDAVINNADRKAGHILESSDRKIWAIDHGVTFNVEPKLRTVLWGWLDEAIPENLLLDLKRILPLLKESEVAKLIDQEEFAQLISRIDLLITNQTFPKPNENWPPVPWPIF